MNTSSIDLRITDLPSTVDPRQMLHRLIANVSGFVYRRRTDARWTMDFLSAGARDITGYDPHRCLGNQSLAYFELIHPGDRSRVSGEIASALARRSRFTVNYRIITAHRTIVTVEDRGIGVYDANGVLAAVEGVVDYSRSDFRTPKRLAVYHAATAC